MSTTLRKQATAFALLAALTPAAGLAGCGDDDEGGCRFDPQSCNGAPGAFCDDNGDCASGLLCCTEDSNCGGGMCTAACDGDRDCPRDMLCEHSVCFYACLTDRDCAAGMSCEHGNTICEWP